MAYLVTCPFCGHRNVSSEARSCPSCNQNVYEKLKKIKEEKEEWERIIERERIKRETREARERCIISGFCPSCKKSVSVSAEKIDCPICGHYNLYDYIQTQKEEQFKKNIPVKCHSCFHMWDCRGEGYKKKCSRCNELINAEECSSGVQYCKSCYNEILEKSNRDLKEYHESFYSIHDGGFGDDGVL